MESNLQWEKKQNRSNVFLWIFLVAELEHLSLRLEKRQELEFITHHRLSANEKTEKQTKNENVRQQTLTKKKIFVFRVFLLPFKRNFLDRWKIFVDRVLSNVRIASLSLWPTKKRRWDEVRRKCRMMKIFALRSNLDVVRPTNFDFRWFFRSFLGRSICNGERFVDGTADVVLDREYSLRTVSFLLLCSIETIDCHFDERKSDFVRFLAGWRNDKSIRLSQPKDRCVENDRRSNLMNIEDNIQRQTLESIEDKTDYFQHFCLLTSTLNENYWRLMIIDCWCCSMVRSINPNLVVRDVKIFENKREERFFFIPKRKFLFRFFFSD